MRIETDGVEIHVHNSHTARLALEEIDRVLTAYLDETAHVYRGTRTRKKYPAHDAECEHCGYEWEYTGKNARYATCPQCTSKVKFDPVLPNRP